MNCNQQILLTEICHSVTFECNNIDQSFLCRICSLWSLIRSKYGFAFLFEKSSSTWYTFMQRELLAHINLNVCFDRIRRIQIIWVEWKDFKFFNWFIVDNREAENQLRFFNLDTSWWYAELNWIFYKFIWTSIICS